MSPTRESILAFMQHAAYRPMRIRELARALKVGHDVYRSFRRLVEEMAEKGELVELRQKRYAVPGSGGFVIGQLHGHQGGFGFVSLDEEAPDIYISGEAMGRALHGDTVMVRVFGRRRGLNPEGEIVRVVERGDDPIIGTYQRAGKTSYVVPDDARITQHILIAPAAHPDASPGQKVVVRITDWPAGQRQPAGVITEVLGYPDDPDIEILSLIRTYDLPLQFPVPVEEEATRIPEVIPPSILQGRSDFRGDRCFTIDPPDARDFDDAVSIEPLPGDRYRLGVHIADVGAYVPEGSLIDREALYRGASVYLVDRVIPMLPHRLTNQICSLNPGMDRLTVSVLMEIGPDGQVLDYAIQDSVIRSVRRLTYEEAQVWIEAGNPDDPDTGPVVRDLRLLRALSDRLLKRRLSQGSLDFDLPEPLIVLDENGKPVDARRTERLDSHRLIEECMLIANQTIAGHLLRAEVPALYRIHQKPTGEKLTELFSILINFGYALTPGDVTHPKQLQEFLSSIQDQPDHPVINDLVVRSMQKARYAVDNVGHYGLAFRWYTHFTSPIRRYPDLVVHRLLREYRNGMPSLDRLDHLERFLRKAADISSQREKIADEAERESIKIKQVEFMEDKIGEEFDGVISGIVQSGAFVELTDTLIEGLVPVAMMRNDYYVFDPDRRQLVGERTRQVLRLGARVRVRVVRADRRLRHIDFELVQVADAVRAARTTRTRTRAPARTRSTATARARPAPKRGRRPPGPGRTGRRRK
jgi:ribonuclease R